MENSTEILNETEKLIKENKLLAQELREAKEAIDAIKKGEIDALVGAEKNDLKVYTEKTADKIYRILIEKMHEGAVTLNEDGIILYSNSSFANMVNQSLQKVIGTHLVDFIEDSKKETFRTIVKKGWENYVSDEVNLIANVGKVIPALISVIKVEFDDENILSVIISDISIRHKIQEELSQRTKQLELKNIELENVNIELIFQNGEKEKRAAELTIANNQLAHQNQEKEKREAELIVANNELNAFTYTLAHDLKAPIRAINGYSRILKKNQETKIDDEGKNYLNLVVENSTRMARMIDDLLEFFKMQKKDITSTEIEMTKLVKNIVDELMKNEQNRTINFKINDLPNCHGDYLMLKQVWESLISNALKFTLHKEKTEISIDSKTTPNEIIYFIKDNGAGFDMKYVDKLFGIFHRLHAMQEFEGNGIGLAVVKRIVEKHKGRVWAEGKVNEGATFYFALLRDAPV